MRNIRYFVVALSTVLAACDDGGGNDSAADGDGGSEGMAPGSGEAGDAETSGDDAEEALVFTVTVDGISIPVHKVDFETPIHFVRFDHVAGATIEVSSTLPYESHKLSPENRGISATKVDNTLSFSVDEPEYLIFQPQGLDRLLILIDPVEEDAPEPGDPGVVNLMDQGIDNTGATLVTETIQTAIDAIGGTGQILYVPPGTYLTGELWLRDAMTLYLADGAVLQGSSELGDIVTTDETGAAVEQCRHALIRMYNVADSHIRGRGIVSGNGANLRDEDLPGTKYNLLKIEESSSCTVDGIVALDPSFWNTLVYRSDAVEITNYKVINNWQSVGWNETDGVNFDSSTNSRLSNAMLYTGDDCMSAKSDDIPDDYAIPEGVIDYPEDPSVGEYMSVNNLVFEDIVCFTNQAGAKIGTKTMGADMSDIVFRNVDVLKCGRGLVIDNMDTAIVHDITFENIEFEYITPFDAVNFIIREGTDWRYSEGVGAIENVTISNVIYNGFPNNLAPLFRIEGRTVEDGDPLVSYPIGTINFSNVFLNDQHIDDTNYTDYIRLVRHEADVITFQ